MRVFSSLLAAIWTVACPGGAARANGACQLRQVADLPLERDAGSGLPTITVALNGNAVRLLVDIAAPVSLIGAPIAEHLGLKLATTDRVSIGVGAESTDLYIRKSTLVIDKLSFTNPLFFVASKTHQFSAVADGVIGMNILRATDVELDFPAGRFRLFDSEGCGQNVVYWQDPYSALPLDRNFYHIPVFRADLDGISVLSTINTTSTKTGLLDRDRCRPDGQYGSFAKLDLGDGLALGHPRILYQCSPVCPTNFDDEIPKMSLGLQQLGHFRIYIADRAQKIYFIAPSTTSAQPNAATANK